MSADGTGESENFLFIAIGCAFTVVAVGAGILVYFLCGCCCKKCKKEIPQIQINSSDIESTASDHPKTCFICGKPKDRVGSGHYNCTMDGC